jgi:nitroreductase
MNVSEAIQKKRAVRMFSSKPVTDEVMNQILEAGRRAQSSKNTQPWQFVVVRDKHMLKALSQTGDFAGHLAGASFAIVLVGTKVSHWNSFDLGQSSAYFQLAAWELGVGSCIAAIYDEAKAKSLLGVPEEMSCYAALSFGYPADDFVPAKMGGRRPLSDVVRWEKW